MLQQLTGLAHTPLPPARENRAAAPARRCRPSGIVAGTLVRTAEGPMPAEYLLAGDRILTRNGSVELRGTSVLELREADIVSIDATALRGSQPRADRPLILPASQPVMIRDWRAMLIQGTEDMLVPASSLVDDLLITRERRATLRLIRLHFDAPQVFWADGVELASARRRAPVSPRSVSPGPVSVVAPLPEASALH